MTVVIRAFNADGYHKDIAIMSEQQVHQHSSKVGEPLQSIMSGLIGVGVGIDIAAFPEMVRFEVVIKDKGNAR
jgi:hypothetical protein